MMIRYFFALVFATTFAVASCADSYDPAESSPSSEPPPIEEQSSGGSGPCSFSGQSCVGSGGLSGVCATSPSTFALVCCVGCVDSGGYCRSGDFAQACGSGGATCAQCALGWSCPNNVCVSYCNPPTEPGAQCGGGRTLPGVWGNTQYQTCTCCSGCFTADGVCVSGTSDTQCGHGGGWCQNCGALLCSSGTCS